MLDEVETVFESDLTSLDLLHRGKVRDIYAVDDAHMLIVASDRLSAFDVVLPDPIPGKGGVLTDLSVFWFRHTGSVVSNHLSDLSLEDVLAEKGERRLVEGRALVVKRLNPLPLEAIVRGYLIGSGWKDYQATGAVSGIALPAGLRQADRLPETIFTPSTKADVGEHDENISFKDIVDLVGEDIATRVRDISVRIYEQAAAYAAERGIIIADTKFEFGLDGSGEIVLIDEVLTPDSSRFWPADQYAVGSSPPSFDKQFVRDYLETLDWDKRPPAPRLPPEVIKKTALKYAEARSRLIE
jgi:phosphoribosylaminoimidazole-succinocarboxamide synthase